MPSPALTSRSFGALLSVALCALFAPGSVARAQSDSRPASRPAAPPTTPELIELGRRLFEEKALSSSGKISCATCHDPARSFADGQALSKGQTEVLMGRNTPTLFGMSFVAAFPDPAPVARQKAAESRKALGLDERCVAPLRNADEMGTDVSDAAAAVGRIASMATEFDRTFGAPLQGATAARSAPTLPPSSRRGRIGRKPSTARRRRCPPREQRGREVFESARCTSCHAGPALTDGLVHVTRTAVRASAAVKPAKPATPPTPGDPTARARALGASATGGYYGFSGGGGPAELQTLTLLDISRTAPYFRDGSAAVLSEAVARHIQELREVNTQRLTVLRALAAREARVAPVAAELRRRVPESAKRLKREAPLEADITAALATHPELETDDWVPPELTETELAYLLDFLGALSPPLQPGG